MPGNQQPMVTKFIWRQNGYQNKEKDSREWSLPLRISVYRPHVTLKELSSYANVSENKLQNRGRYLFWRVFFDFVSKNLGLKGESRCKILCTSSIIPGNCIAMNLLSVKLEKIWEPFVVFGRFSVWTETVAIIIYNDLNVYGMFKLSEYWTRVRCNVVHLLQGKEVRSLYVVFVHTKSLLKDGHSTGLQWETHQSLTTAAYSVKNSVQIK